MTITILFDTETTGLVLPQENELSKQPYITEIYCLKVKKTSTGWKKMGDFNRLLKPPVPLSAEITKITGITNEMLEWQPTFSDIYYDLAEFFVGTECLVAHNLAFDKNLLLFELARIESQFKFPWPYSHVCTVEKSMSIQQRRMSLSNLYKELIGGTFEAHRAKNDVNAMFECYKVMDKRGMLS